MAFDVVQNPNYFSQKDFFKNHKKAFDNLIHPFSAIERDGGYKKFFTDEFLGKRAVPNIGLHLFGGGYDSRYITEYFKEQGYRYPTSMMLLLIYAGHLGNEAYELSNPIITSHDNVADVYFYDLLGILMFQNDTIAEFFHQKLGLRRWEYWPQVNINTGEIGNAGVNYIFRPNFIDSPYKLFFFGGMQVLLGLSYNYHADEIMTLAAGMAFTDPIKNEGHHTIAMFYEKDERLVASLLYQGTEEYKFRVNLYPDSFPQLKKKEHQLGMMLGLKNDMTWAIGINYNLAIGISTFL